MRIDIPLFVSFNTGCWFGVAKPPSLNQAAGCCWFFFFLLLVIISQRAIFLPFLLQAAPLLLRGASGGNPPALLLEQQQEGYKNGGTGGGFLRGLGAGEKEEALLHQRVRDLQALFQTCPADPGQNGVFPDEGFFSDSRCLTYGTAGLIGIEKLIEVLAGEDSTMSKTADSVLAPLMMVSEKGADMAGIDFRICAADFPGAKVKKPTMDMNMVDICKGLPLQKTDDAEWAIFAFQLGIPEAIASVACQIPKDISIQACVGVSLCGDFPSVAFAFNAGLASCIIGQVGYATAGIGSAIAAGKYSFLHRFLRHSQWPCKCTTLRKLTPLSRCPMAAFLGIEMGIDKIGAGFSLTNAFEVPLTVFNGFDLLPYTARPTLYLQARFAIESKKIDALMDGWFVIGIEGIFGLSVWIEDDELADDQLVEGRVNSWNMNATCNNSTDTPDSGLFDLFDDLTLEMFLTVKADFTLDLKKVFAKPKPGTEGATTAADGGTNSAADCGLGCEGTTGAEMSEAGASLSKKKEGFSIANYLPKISIPQAAEMSAHVTTGERVVEEHIIYPGVSFYVGLSAAASFVKSLAADILKALDGITVSRQDDDALLI